MATTRTYGDGCAIARALDVVGERWSLLVVRELLLGPKRYTDLRRGLPNASPNVLAERLRELEESGVIQRRKLPPPAAARVYELTAWGLELEAIVTALGRWTAASPAPVSIAAPVASADSVILALRDRFDARAARGRRVTYALHLGEDRYRVDIADEQINVARGDADDADATIDSDPETLTAVLWGRRSLAGALRARKMTIAGDQAAVERFVRLFPLALE
jgi:DNA-binding HxlR family transcriptional regulator